MVHPEPNYGMMLCILCVIFDLIAISHRKVGRLAPVSPTNFFPLPFTTFICPLHLFTTPEYSCYGKCRLTLLTAWDICIMLGKKVIFSHVGR